MTVFAKLKQALLPFGIPFSTDFSGGGEEEYFTINEAGDVGEDFGDDDPGVNVLSTQVHWILPSSRDYLTKKKQIRKAIYAAGCTYPTVTVINDDDLGVRHIIFESDSEEDY